MSNQSRHLEVIYCDDIREEIGNKLSYMGVYSGELTVPAAPVMLSKLCISVKVVTDISDPLQEIEVRVLRGEEQTELLSTGMIPAPTDTPSFDDDATRIIVQMAFMLAPFQIDEETILRVKATTEQGDLNGMALRIRIATPSAPTTVEQSKGSK